MWRFRWSALRWACWTARVWILRMVRLQMMSRTRVVKRGARLVDEEIDAYGA